MGDRRGARFGYIGVLGVVGLAFSACGADPAPSAHAPRLEAVEIPAIGDPRGTETTSGFDIGADAATALPAPVDHGPAAMPEMAVAGVAVPEVAAAPELHDLDQPAIWPAADVVFATPEEAAADFVSAVLISDGDPALGEFQQGDTRSGEIAVLWAGETGDLDPPLEKGLLLLRQIGPTDGWYVIAATSDGATIDAPSALEEVPAGTVTVSGEGRGFEGTLVVSAFRPGDDTAPLDLQIGRGGNAADLDPYSVELDLSGAASGEVIVILVHGDTGLGNDPSTFAAIPIVIASAPPVTIPATR
jgi:hypothetical protein